MLASLDREVAGLNIEGAVVSGTELRLFQRGNKRNSENAIIRFQLSTFLDALTSGQTAAIAPLAIKTFDLGQVDGIPLCFTDGAAPPDGRMVFTAVAEGVDDNYNDGLVPARRWASWVMNDSASIPSIGHTRWRE
jgi:hypothetical protein